MTEEFYIGQIFEEMYPAEASDWCNSNKAMIREITPTTEGVRRFEIMALPEPPAPTHDEISSMRKHAYEVEIDPLHSRKQRKSILGEWTDELETEYQEQVRTLSAEIAERFPYPDEN